MSEEENKIAVELTADQWRRVHWLLYHVVSGKDMQYSKNDIDVLEEMIQDCREHMETEKDSEIVIEAYASKVERLEKQIEKDKTEIESIEIAEKTISKALFDAGVL